MGGMIGLLVSYYGGFLDSLLMRITDIMMAFPSPSWSSQSWPSWARD
ncbi:hypothetical protein M5E87_02680 [Flavonifractor plautii]|nr:hypothetical protein M5E87_02680 [Flavonifractor plautii]